MSWQGGGPAGGVGRRPRLRVVPLNVGGGAADDAYGLSVSMGETELLARGLAVGRLGEIAERLH